MDKGAFFNGVVQWKLENEELGLEGKLPVFYFDNTAMTAIFTASTDMVRRLLPGLTVLSMMARRYFTAYVWQLPVTTERARIGGVEMYGYPKFLADIVFVDEGNMLACTLSEGGKDILTLKGRKLKTGTEKINRFKTYSIKENVPLVANVYMNPREFAKSMSARNASPDSEKQKAEVPSMTLEEARAELARRRNSGQEGAKSGRKSASKV